MAITLDSTDLSTCEAQTGWSVFGGAQFGSPAIDTDLPARKLDNTLKFKLVSTTTGGLKYTLQTGQGTVDIRNKEVSLWFLQINNDESGGTLFTPGAATASDIRFRAYSSQSGTEHYADYYQDQHIDFTDSWKGGWLQLRLSGDAGTEDADGPTAGDWVSADAAAVDAFGLYVTHGTQSGNDPAHRVDWLKVNNKIIVSGYNGGTTPWTPSDIYDEDVATVVGTGGAGDGDVWGVVEQTENFFSFNCPIDFGDGTTAGAFTAENEYLFMNQSSADADHDIVVKNNFTCTLGKKNDTGTVGTYAENGCQLVVQSNPKWGGGTPTPDITVESGGILQNYAGLIRGFNVINLGSGGSSAIDLIGTDFFDNVDTEFRSTGLKALDIRLHFPNGSEAAPGTVDNIPNTFEGIKVFQVTDGLQFNVTMDVERYEAGDTTNDLVVAASQIVTLINSIFDETKLKGL